LRWFFPAIAFLIIFIQDSTDIRGVIYPGR
jgi:hypothetical protein